MILGTVAGDIDSTINHPFYDAKKLRVVEKLDAAGNPSGNYLIAVDQHIDARVGDTVLVLDEGNGARQVMESADAPIRSIIVGIVDAIDRG